MNLDSSRIFRGVLVVLSLGACALPSLAQRLDVTDQGTPSYHVPIAVPPGAGGLVPKLSVDYTASSGNGIVGYGWSLSGMSTIGRCRATIATDGQPGAVRWIATDKLCLDGKRLIALDSNSQPLVGRDQTDAAGITGGTPREYRLESDEYSRIRAYGIADASSTNSGPLFFRVWTKDGHIIDYGTSPQASDSNANIVPAASTKIGYKYAQAWAVSRIADVYGNRVDFKYAQQDRTWGSNASYQLGHEWWLAEVQYSGNKVLLSYEDRPTTAVADASEGYNYGAKNLSIKRLKTVTTYVNAPNTSLGVGTGAVPVQTLVLAYSQGFRTTRSLLSSVQVCAGAVTSGKCLPKTTFSYSTGTPDVYTPNTKFNLQSTQLSIHPYTLQTPFIVMTNDFNGSGRTDILTASVDSAGVATSQLLLSNGDGSFTPAPFYNMLEPLVSRYQCYDFRIADFNGDGLPDILRVSNPTGYDDSGNAHACNNAYPTKIFFNNGNGKFTPVTVTGAPNVQISLGIYALGPTTFSFSTAPFQTSVLDMDGDGIADLLVTTYPAVSHQSYLPSPNPCANIVCTWAYKGNGDGSFKAMPTNMANTSMLSTANYGANVLDIDGDGLQDIFVTTLFNMTPYSVARSTGDFNFVTLGKTMYDVAEPFDYKGDGRVSLLNFGSSAACSVYIADQPNADLTRLQNFGMCNGGATYPYDSNGGGNAGALIQDFNGDGKQDFLHWDSSGSNTLYTSNGDGTFTKSTTFQLQAPSGTSTQLGAGNYGVLTGDFTGHGETEIIQTLAGGKNTLWTRAAIDKPDLLVSVTNPSGSTDSVSYAMSSDGAVYAGEARGSVPVEGHVSDVPANLYLVSSLSQDTQSVAPLVTKFAYQGLKQDRDGRGLLGFHVTTRQSVAPDGSTILDQVVHAIPFPYTGKPLTTDHLYSPNGWDVTTTVYCDQAAPAQVAATAIASNTTCPGDPTVHVKHPYPLLQTTQSVDLSNSALPGKTVQITLTPDGEPSLVSDTTTVPAGASGTVQTLTSTTFFPDDTSCQADQLTCNWFLARKQQETVEKIVPSAIASTSAGSAANASTTDGRSPQAVAAAAARLNAVLQVITSLLLQD